MTPVKLINGSKYRPLSIYIEKCENVKKNAASRQYTHNVLTEYGMGNLRSMWIGRITQGGTMSSSIEVSTYHTLGIQTN